MLLWLAAHSRSLLLETLPCSPVQEGQISKTSDLGGYRLTCWSVTGQGNVKVTPCRPSATRSKRSRVARWGACHSERGPGVPAVRVAGDRSMPTPLRRTVNRRRRRLRLRLTGRPRRTDRTAATRPIHRPTGGDHQLCHQTLKKASVTSPESTTSTE